MRHGFYHTRLEPGRSGGYVIRVSKLVTYEESVVVPSDVIDDDEELDAHIALMKQKIEEQINGSSPEAPGQERTDKG